MPQLLKKDLFGEVWLAESESPPVIIRDTQTAVWWLAPVARSLLRREARALQRLASVDAVPRLIQKTPTALRRQFLRGEPLHRAKSREQTYYRAAFDLLRKLHSHNVAHNDLAKEPNLLVLDNGRPALIDFQLAIISKRRGLVFRLAAREDLRHLLKHKRTYRPDLLTTRERRILDSPTFIARFWMATIKPIYVFVTRRIFGWADREGAADRGRRD